MAYRREDTDWRCSSCSFSNFRRRQTCKSCGAPKGNARRTGRQGGVADPSRSRKAGDWTCPQCRENNFAKRSRCFKCRADKPRAGLVEQKEAPQRDAPDRRDGGERRERRERGGRGNGGGRRRSRGGEGEQPAGEAIEVDEKDQDFSRVEIAAGTFASLAAGGVVESIELNTESDVQSIRVEWHTGPSTGKANAFFRQNGSALLAVEAIRRTQIGGRLLRPQDPEAFELKGENVFKVHLQGVPLDYDDEMLTRAIDGLGVEDFVEAFVFRRENAVVQTADIIGATLKSMFDSFGMIRLKSHPPRFGTAAAILDFPDTTSCLAAIGAMNNTPCSFGSGKLKVKLDLRCIVATQQDVWDVLSRDIDDLMYHIRRSRAEFPSVKVFLFGRDRSATGQSRAVVCGADAQAVCKARALYNDLLRPLLLYLDADALVHLVAAQLREHIASNAIPRVDVKAAPAAGIIRVYAAPETRKGLNEFAQGVLSSMVTQSIHTTPKAVRLLLGAEDFANLNSGRNDFHVFVSANLSEATVDVVGLTADEVAAGVAHIEATYVAGNEDAEMKEPGAENDEQLCGVCFMDFEPGETTTTLTSCTHVFHSECLMHQCKSSLGVTGTRPLTCAQCQVPLELNSIASFLTLEQMTDLSKLCARDFLRTHPAEFKQCPTPDCNQIYPADGTGLFNCSECLRQYCMTCREADGTLANYHAGMTCDSFQKSKDSDASFAEFMKSYSSESTSKECPYCHTMTDKFTNTCNHATCVYCKTHFCWKCLWVHPSDRFSGQNVYGHMTSAHGGWYTR